MSPRGDRAGSRPAATGQPARQGNARHPWRWIALAAGLALDVQRSTRIVLVTAAAVSTEGVVWLGALLLGLRVVEARRRLWRRLRSLFG